jgi:hypothetical protein
LGEEMVGDRLVALACWTPMARPSRSSMDFTFGTRVVSTANDWPEMR